MVQIRQVTALESIPIGNRFGERAQRRPARRRRLAPHDRYSNLHLRKKQVVYLFPWPTSGNRSTWSSLRDQRRAHSHIACRVVRHTLAQPIHRQSLFCLDLA